MHLQAPERHASGAFAFLAQASMMATSPNMAGPRTLWDSWDSWDSGECQISPGFSAAGGPSSCVRDFGDTSHDSQIVSKAGEDFHLKGRVGCRTHQKRLHCEGTRSYKHVLSQRRYGRDVTVLRNSSCQALSSFRMEPKHSIHDSCDEILNAMNRECLLNVF